MSARRFLVTSLAVLPLALAISAAGPAAANAYSCAYTTYYVVLSDFPSPYIWAQAADGNFISSGVGSGFCVMQEAPHNGTTEYVYVDETNGECVTAGYNGALLYDSPCGLHLNSDEWHYYETSPGSGTLKNWYTGSCWWFIEPQVAEGSTINDGGCNLNQNTAVTMIRG
jgi:hypothetical protein